MYRRETRPQKLVPRSRLKFCRAVESVFVPAMEHPSCGRLSDLAHLGQALLTEPVSICLQRVTRQVELYILLTSKNQPNLDLYLVRRYKICHFPIVVLWLCIGQNQKNQPNLVLYLVRRSKIFVSVSTLIDSLF